MPLDDDQSIKEVLGLDPVAVVDCSTEPGVAAHDVPRYLLDNGYSVVPINPDVDEVFGIPAADTLREVDEPVSLVSVFRPSSEVPGILDDVLGRTDVKAIWLHLDITHDEAVRRAESAGLLTVQDRCMRIEHQRLFSP